MTSSSDDHGASPAQNTVTVLLADDRAEDRQLLRVILERLGYNAVEASDGIEALDLARKVRPQLILSDILMPKMDGFMLCRRLQEDAELRHVPFVFVTATYSELRFQQSASEAGAARVLLKPYTAQELRNVIEQALTQGTPTDVAADL